MKQRTNLQQASLTPAVCICVLVHVCGHVYGHIGLASSVQPKINKILKTLEERLLVKSVKSVQNASRKVQYKPS
jgi:hypothetical protein